MRTLQFSLIFIFIGQFLTAQVYLQIEKINSTKRIKLTEGTMINFKLKEYPDTWRKAEIDQILPESNTLIIDGDIITPDEILEISLLFKPFLRNLGTQLERFALSLAVYGTIVELADLDQFWYKGYIISGSVFVVGRLLKMIFRKKVYKMNRRFRLRIVDTRFFIPEN